MDKKEDTTSEKNISDSDRNVEYDNSTNEDSDFNLDDVVEVATRSPKVRKDLAGDSSGYHVISMVDDEEMKLGTSNGPIEVTEYKVHEIMGIPNGEVSIDCLEERKPNDPFIKEWFQQFPSGKKDIRPNDITDVIVGSDDHGKLFRMNFLMLFANTMGICETQGACSMNILKRINDDIIEKVESINWCKFIIDSLGQSLQRWKKNKSTHFTGPQTFMTLLYLDSTRCDAFPVQHQRPAISGWKTILMKYREKIEIESGGLSVYNISDFQNFVEKIQRSFNNINLEMASISSSLKEGLSRFPSCDNLKKLLEEFKRGISSNAFMEEDRGCDQSQAETNSTENINAESQYRTQAESTNEVEKPIEDKSQHSEKEHEPPVDIEEPTKEHHVADTLNQEKEGSISDQSERSKQDISTDTGKTEVTSEPIVNVQKDEITKVTKANDSTKECDTDVTPMVEEQEIPAKSSMEESDATASETMMGNSNMEGQTVEKSIEERVTNPSEIVAEDSTMEDQVVGKQQEPEIDAESSIKEDEPKAPTDVNVQKDEITEVTKANDSTKECDTDVTPMVEEQQIPATASETLMGNSNMEGQDVEKSMEERVTKPSEIVAEDTTMEEQVVADPSETKAEDSTMEYQVAGKQQEPKIDAESSFKEDEPKAPNETRADESNMPEKTNEEDKNEGPAWEPIFKSERGEPILYHFDMETMTSNLEISTNVIDIWSEILNVMELYKEDMMLPSRYFFKISFILFFPICRENHLYLICADFKNGSFRVIDNSSNGTDFEERYKSIPQEIKKVLVAYLDQVKHPKTERIRISKPIRMQMKWRTKNNHVDCGVFLMLHMESYHGLKNWECGLHLESDKQKRQLDLLRSKYATKILLSELNLIKNKFLKLFTTANSRKTRSNKRGRPKKSQANSQSNIDSTASPASNPASPASNKRGRPKKSQTNSQSNIDSTASPASNPASPASKKRGRPKKSQTNNQSNIDSTDSPNSNPASPASKKRGRPKKSQTNSQSNIDSTDSPNSNPASPASKKRGRPKKSQTNSQSNIDSTDSPNSNPASPASKKRGRPKKSQTNSQSNIDSTDSPNSNPASPASKKRGRPKKSQTNSQSNIDSTDSPNSNPASPASKKRGRPKKSQTNSQSNIDSTDSPNSNPASPASKKRGRPKKSQPNIASTASPSTDFSSPSTDMKGEVKLIYIHSTHCVTDSMPHKTPAIRYWSSDNIKDRDSFEFENGGFGILNLYEKDNDANDSFENKLKMDKLSQNVDLLERILSDINSEIKICSSKIPDNPRLKEIKAKFNNCIRNEYLSAQDKEDLNDEKDEDEETGFEKKNVEKSDDDVDDFSNVHLSDDDLGANDSGHGSQSKDEEIKAKEDKELHHMRKRKQSENELDRRQKRRVEEVRESEKKKEECINLKEQYRIEVRDRLTRLERRSFNFRSFLANVGLHIAEADYEIKNAYKQAAKKFHPDRAPKDDLYKHVEAEETFKVIQQMKDQKDPPIINVSE
ncbi:hypothetical protein CTI12_AA142780 [Artemisia annua]|uniref:J domain-containing protein n=1 Tax=Artemisia annua TaxID=35608 RepID=A0A2U1PJZ6_ARTAN|nr:hypothetical protein CTI12_AA142780 [Artemisia annua]